MQESRSQTNMGPSRSRTSSEKSQRHEIPEGSQLGFKLGDFIYKLKRGIKVYVTRDQKYKTGVKGINKVGRRVVQRYKPGVFRYVTDVESQKSQEKTA